jgi:hypothetical protein
MATVIDARRPATPAPVAEPEPAVGLPNLVALLRRRSESATDAPVGRVPPPPPAGAATTSDAYGIN